MSDDATLLAPAGPPGGFQKGDDSRRWRGGPVPATITKFRADLDARLPRALEVLDDLLEHKDWRARHAAAVEIMDRTLGKPKSVDVDASGIVRGELASIFGQLRERLTAEAYKALVMALADAEREPPK